MLSVERELLELVTDNRYINKESISIRRWEALCKLRSILSKPAAQHQGEAVAFVDERAAYEEWQWRQDWPIEQLAGAMRAEYFKRKFLEPERYETDRFNSGLAVWLARATRPVQGEPVAICRLWNEGGSGERTSVEFVGEPCADGTLLYTEQPAPVAVVMPGRKCPSEYRDSSYTQTCMSGEYNRALDDVSKFNGLSHDQ